jgi:predicted DNA-binding protein
MSDANVRIPEEAKDRLAAIAAAEGLSLRAYLAHLAETLLTPAERAERAEKALAALKEWNGYTPTAAQEQDLDDELDGRLARVTAG